MNFPVDCNFKVRDNTPDALRPTRALTVASRSALHAQMSHYDGTKRK